MTKKSDDDANAETETETEIAADPTAPDDGPQLTGTEELEAALQAAIESRDARDTSDAGAGAPLSMDKVTIEALSLELRGLKAAYEEREGELEAQKDRHLRLQAEFENFRRRSMKEKQETQLYGPQNLVKDLLTTVDNLERAIDHSEQSGDADLKSLLQGVELVQRELLGTLQNHGVVVVEADGQPFDPAVHEAMGQVPNDEVPTNTVIEVLQKGYLLRDRLLRPARVILSTPAAGGSGGDGSE